MSNIFKCPAWDAETSGHQIKFDFQKSKNKKQKNKPKKDSAPGRFVRIDKNFYEQETTQNKGDSHKRKSNDGNNSDEVPNKKVKSSPEIKGDKKSSNSNVGLKYENKQKNNDANENKKFKSKPKSDKKLIGSLKERLVDSLKGSRFRYLNEQLYTSEGKDAIKFFNEDPNAFNVYHEGYRQQVAQWPLNPLDRLIKAIRKLPKDHVIADFGCGEARLSKSVPHKVYSLDVIPINEDVIACDMAKTPLETNSINVVVYCLSLMGTNLHDFFVEANRVLKVGGLVKIAEVESRFENLRNFISSVEKCGFSLINKDLSNNMFYFINFKKVADVKMLKNIKPFSLKACLYKKR